MRVPVVLTPAKLMDFDERLAVQGDVQAKNFALVTARVLGTLDAIYVDEGDKVEAGKTKLFQVDALNLEKAVDASRQALAVARCSTREKEANRDGVAADFHKAEKDYRRYEQLRKDGVVTQDALEQAESRYLQVQAQLKHAETLIDLAKAQEGQTQAALAIAEKNLADSLIMAPISGTITARFKEPGEMAEAGKPVVRIEDLSVVEPSAFLPAEYYHRVVPGETQMSVGVNGVDAGTRAVSYRSPTIQSKLRTFEVRCVITDPTAGVVPGAMADIAVVLDRRRGLGVPVGTIQQRGDRQVVFVVENGRAKMVDVKVGLQTDGSSEISAESLAEGAGVVTMGQSFLNDGTAVDVQKASK